MNIELRLTIQKCTLCIFDILKFGAESVLNIRIFFFLN